MTRQIKILHVAEAAGGVERYLENLFRFNNNCKVRNYLIYSQNYDSKFLIENKNSFGVIMSHGLNVKSDIRSINSIKKIIHKVDPDIIYAHSTKAGALARLANISIHKKIIYNPHGWAFNEEANSILGKIKISLFKNIERIESLFTDNIVCISNFERDTAIANHITDPRKLRIIYSGIDLDQNHCSKIDRKKLGIPEDAFLVGMVARITETKAPDIFIRAAKKIKQKIPNAYFLLIGDGDLRKQAESLIKNERLEKCFLITGWVDNTSDYMNILNIGVLLSRWEGLGLVLLEYMRAGIPIIATNVGGIPDVIQDKKSGLLVPKDNVDSVACAVEKIYKEKGLATKLVINGHKEVKQRFDIKRTVLETEEMYKKILN